MKTFFEAGTIGATQQTIFKAPYRCQVTLWTICSTDAVSQTVRPFGRKGTGTPSPFRVFVLATDESGDVIDGDDTELFLNEGDSLEASATIAGSVFWMVSGREIVD